jgi:predicted transcriptional regulator
MEKEWERLTSRQREIIQQMKVLKSQGAVARKLKISQPAVSKVLSIPTIRKMTESERVLYEFLAFLAEYLI